ncbi:SRSO17 transposase [Catenulispora sp. GP43]
MRDLVVDRLGAGGTLVLDETGDAKKGAHTVGVQRQYSGTAGRIENTQVTVCAVWATSHGASFVDRELYLPRSWTDDPDRCRAAGLPEDLQFATRTPVRCRHLPACSGRSELARVWRFEVARAVLASG